MKLDFANDIKFSGKYAFLRLFGELFQLAHISKISDLIWKKRNEFIVSCLREEMLPLIQEYRDNDRSGESCNLTAPIWICWWQGVEEAPELVKRCIDSVYNHSSNHQVNLITKKTINEYINVPQSIINSAESGNIRYANLADYIRTALIAKYGGIWIDATVYMTQTIKEEYFAIPFYTVNGDRFDGYYIAGGRWATYVIGGWKGSKLFGFIEKAMNQHISKHNGCIDYFLIDYLIELAYREFDDIKEIIDNVPPNNPNRFALRDAMNLDLEYAQMHHIITEDTIFYKLSHKSNYGKYDKDGKETIYAKLFLE